MSNYFSYLPNFEYVNRIPSEQNISSYTEVKNLFKRVRLNDKLFQDLTNFTKYQIVGDERPDNVANKIYNNPNYDWIVLLSNNIINIQDEWPMTNRTFELYMNKKYGVTNYDNIHHYESIEVKDSSNNYTILKKGLEVPSDYSITFYDGALGNMSTVTNTNVGVTNYEYESKIQDDKRNIFLLRSDLIQTVIRDIKKLMQYKDGSTQFVTKALVKADNINLF
jgi:hypothetical protein|tara:strand:+ start:104 stop:769 length:666 start_codon:yes stop_codon:yes gene_type:complete